MLSSACKSLFQGQIATVGTAIGSGSASGLGLDQIAVLEQMYAQFDAAADPNA